MLVHEMTTHTCESVLWDRNVETDTYKPVDKSKLIRHHIISSFI